MKTPMKTYGHGSQKRPGTITDRPRPTEKSGDTTFRVHSNRGSKVGVRPPSSSNGLASRSKEELDRIYAPLSDEGSESSADIGAEKKPRTFSKAKAKFDPPREKSKVLVERRTARASAEATQAPRHGQKRTLSEAIKTRTDAPLKDAPSAPGDEEVMARPPSRFAPSKSTGPRPQVKRPKVHSDSSPKQSSLPGRTLPSTSRVPPSPSDHSGSVAKQADSGRVRLIDRLAVQAQEGSDAESESEFKTVQDSTSTVVANALADVPSTPQKGGEIAPTFSSQTTQSVKRRKVRTYGQQRSMRSGDTSETGRENVDHFSLENPLDSSQPSKMTSFDALAFDEGDMEEDARPKGGILGLHALRQAGANHRFANELGDLFERVGSPQPHDPLLSRSRKSALLEFGRKLQDEKFVSLFSDYGEKEILFRGIGKEEDIINGFILMAALLILLKSQTIPHLIDQLSQEGAARLMSRLIGVDEDISSFASRKQNNLSKYSQASLSTLRSTLLRLDVWDSATPCKLSPRRLTLKSLSLSCRSLASVSNARIVSSLSGSLFGVVSDAKTSLPSGDGDRDIVDDVTLALSLLQEHSVAAVQSNTRASWLDGYLPLIASILPAILNSPSKSFGELETQTLKLVMNATNSPQAATVFGEDRLVLSVSGTALARFRDLQTALGQGDFPTGLYGDLTLLLGVLINMAEHCISVRRFFADRKDEAATLLDGLVSVYLENRDSSGSVSDDAGVHSGVQLFQASEEESLTSGQADSYEQTQLVVAYGYLAILLGYLSLEPDVRRHLNYRSSGRGVKYVLGTIREFMAFHEKVAAATDDMSQSLQSLMRELQLVS